MPRPGSSSGLGAYSSGRGRPLGLSVEETAGITILAIIVALVLIIGCWYFKRRSGYKILGTRQLRPSAICAMIGGTREPAECKVPLQDYNTLNVAPGAPPAYEKISAEAPQPPPYTP